jgi:hypothetical protein
VAVCGIKQNSRGGWHSGRRHGLSALQAEWLVALPPQLGGGAARASCFGRVAWITGWAKECMAPDPLGERHTACLGCLPILHHGGSSGTKTAPRTTGGVLLVRCFLLPSRALGLLGGPEATRGWLSVTNSLGRDAAPYALLSDTKSLGGTAYSDRHKVLLVGWAGRPTSKSPVQKQSIVTTDAALYVVCDKIGCHLVEIAAG